MTPDHARRFIAVIQDARGYPAPNDPPEPAPPDGPEQPMVHSVVLASDYGALLAEYQALKGKYAAGNAAAYEDGLHDGRQERAGTS